MNPGKRFFLIFSIVYAVIAIAWIVLFGPAGYSKDFEAANKTDIDRYFEIIKSDEYKLHKQSPQVHPADDGLRAAMVFLEEFDARPGVRAENRRRDTFHYFFEFFNAAAVVVLIVRYARKPLITFLDTRVSEIRERMERIEHARREAAERRAAADEQLSTLAAETERIGDQGQEMAKQEVTAIEEGTHTQLGQIDEEEEIRLHVEEMRAAMCMRAELVESAMGLVEDRLAATHSEARETVLVDQFLTGLERAR
jgi:F-type H+-transporting ATPase subunit b